jgi:hypothetical protein
MRITGFVGQVVVSSMQADPVGRAELQIENAEGSEEALPALGARDASVREKPVVPDIDAQDRNEEVTEKSAGHARPREEIGNEGKTGDQVVKWNADQKVDELGLPIIIGQRLIRQRIYN